MFKNSASRLLEIQENVDYSIFDYKIFSLHCIQGNSDNLEMQAICGDSVIYPPNSFIQGAVYYIFLKQIQNLGGAKFIGFANSGVQFPLVKLKQTNDS